MRMKEQNKEIKEASMKTQNRKNVEYGSCQARQGWKGFPAAIRKDCRNKKVKELFGTVSSFIPS